MDIYQKNKPSKLLDQVRNVIHHRHYSIHTEQSDADWTKRFVFFHHKRHPIKMRMGRMFFKVLAEDGLLFFTTALQDKKAI